MANDDATGTEDGAAAKRDASLRVDTKTLSSEEQDFARMMGFAGDADAGAPATPPARPAASTTAPAAPAATTSIEAPPAAAPVTATAPETEPPAATALASEETPAESAPHTERDDVPTNTDEVPHVDDEEAVPARVFEEIHPRAATLGRQSALIERADRVVGLAGSEAASARPSVAAADEEDTGASRRASPNDDTVWLERLHVRDARIAELESAEASMRAELKHARLAPPAAAPSAPPAPMPATEIEKELERLRVETDGLLQERDRLSDELAIANAARAQAQARAERFEVTLRAARGPEGPLPDGERELRAEVVGLRRRLEAAGAENRGLRESLEAGATDLAIARAHGEDRQQEIEQLKERIASLEQERSVQVERLDEALVRQRELLALVTRVQAENVELRSTQAALEETLEARDLEINAREEHLQVTRRGLVTRDQQLRDAEERLEQARHRHSVLEAELEQQARANAQLEEKLARRDARIASLSTTLTRIEQAIGRPAPVQPPEDEPPAPSTPRRSPARALESPTGPETAAPASAVSATSTANASTTIATVADDEGPRAAAPSLPPILVRWRDAQLRTLFGEEGPASVEAFLAQQLGARQAGTDSAGLRLLSLGGARPETEIRLLEALRERGVGSVSIRVLDRSPALASARRAAIEAAGLTEQIEVEAWSGQAPVAPEPVHALLVCDALQGWSAPAATLAELATGLSPEGIVLFADRIAGGPVTLSTETREKLAELWQVLPESLTNRSELAHAPETGEDGGSAAPGDEALVALLDVFTPVLTVGLGHIADLFVGPARGFALSEVPEAAPSLFASIEAIDESRAILESLPPRHGVAVCVRPEALAAADAGPESLGLPWPSVSR